MAEQYYTVPEMPQYNENIRRIQNSDPVNADEIVNPVIEALMENIAAVMKQAADAADKAVVADIATQAAMETANAAKTAAETAQSTANGINNTVSEIQSTVSGLNSTVSGLSSAVSNLQTTVSGALKIASGSYVGSTSTDISTTGTLTKTITVGFKPKLLICLDPVLMYLGYSPTVFLVWAGQPSERYYSSNTRTFTATTTGLTITATGSKSSTINSTSIMDSAGYTYNWLAIG